METQKGQLAAPCGMYCGVCAIYIAHRDDNLKFKERLTGLYGVPVFVPGSGIPFSRHPARFLL